MHINRQKAYKYITTLLKMRFGVFFLIWMAVFPARCRALQAEVGKYPDFKRCFDILTENRVAYNQYNDSIFIIKEHDQWVKFFRHRALRNHQIYISNKEVLRTIEEYFSQDRRLISVKAYKELHDCAAAYFYNGKSDPFLMLKFCRILNEYAKDAPDSLNFSNVQNAWEAVSYSSIYNLGYDSTALEKSYQCFMRTLDERNKSYPYYTRGLAYSLLNLCMSTWVVKGLQSLEENRGNYRRLLALMDSVDLSKVLLPSEYPSLKNTVHNYDELLVRNVYMSDTTSMEKQVVDSLMQRIVKRNLSNKNLSLNSFQRTLLMQNMLGELTVEEAGEQLWKRYLEEREALAGKKLQDSQLSSFIYPCFTLLFFNDKSNKSFSKKRKFVKRLCRDIEVAYQSRADGQSRINYVRILNQLTTYPRLIKYLNEKERIRFLSALNVATQVTTYAHSVHVSMIAQELMKGVVKYQPQLLAGTLGHEKTSEVRTHKREYLDFIHDAAMYHDLGKNSIITVVNNDYRPLTDEEFAIIKRHPRLGMQYLKLGPSLEKYRDTTLGHHKWYNGKGGYPDDFDNTKSPIRILIDIVTLSDCMQAATERLGRNYRGEKTFDAVMAEFRKDAGTIYNPDLVALIDAHPDLAENLAELINDGWVEIYYDIYSQFIR